MGILKLFRTRTCIECAYYNSFKGECLWHKPPRPKRADESCTGFKEKK